MFTNPATASSLNVNMRGTLVDVKAEYVPLIEILKAISDKAEIDFKYSDPLSEPVSVDIQKISVEECIRRLLGNRSYTLTFKKIDGNQFIPLNLEVFGTEGATSFAPSSSTGAQAENSPFPPQDDSLKRYERTWFKHTFSDSEKLIKEISTIPSGYTGISPNRGLKIKDISENSAFHQIGIKKGDIVTDVNGHSISSTKEFLDTLQASSEKQDSTTIRIERLNSNQMVDPIYIELH